MWMVYAESNGHVTDDVTRPYDVIVVTQWHDNAARISGYVAYRHVCKTSRPKLSV